MRPLCLLMAVAIQVALQLLLLTATPDHPLKASYIRSKLNITIHRPRRAKHAFAPRGRSLFPQISSFKQDRAKTLDSPL
jgi:hypothetical protein